MDNGTMEKEREEITLTPDVLDESIEAKELQAFQRLQSALVGEMNGPGISPGVPILNSIIRKMLYDAERGERRAQDMTLKLMRVVVGGEIALYKIMKEEKAAGEVNGLVNLAMRAVQNEAERRGMIRITN